MSIDPEEREARLKAAEALRGFKRSLDVASAALGPMADSMETYGHMIPLSVELRTPERLRRLLIEMLSVGDDLSRIVREIEAC
jgi:hypothetical protein